MQGWKAGKDKNSRRTAKKKKEEEAKSQLVRQEENPQNYTTA